MYQVSDAYKEAINSGVINSYISGTITLTDGTVIDVERDCVENLSINNKCVDSESLEFGQLYTGEMTADIYLETDRYSIYDAELALIYNLKIGAEYESVPLGEFYVSEATKETKTGPIHIVAYDNMGAFKTSYDGTTKTGTPYELISFICEKAGVELETTKEEIDAMANGSTLLGISPEYGWENWQAILSDICEILAGFGYIGNTGGLVIRGFQNNISAYITKNNRMDAGTSADYLCSYSRILISTSEGDVASGEENGTGLTMEITDNPFFTKGTQAHNQAVCDSIWETLRLITYTPCSVQLYDDPAYQLGDRICVSDFSFGDGTETLIFSYNWTYRGGNDVECSGENPRLAQTKTTTEKKLEMLTQTIEAEKFIYQTYRNGDALNITDLTKIIHLYYALSNATTMAVLQGHINIQVVCDTNEETGETLPGTVTLHYYLNGVEDVEIVPIITVRDGYALIPIYYLTGGVTGKANELEVYMECENCTATIPTYGSYGSLSGQGMKAVVQEWDGTITVEQVFQKVTPTGGWNIAIEAFNADVSVTHPEHGGSEFAEQMTRIELNTIGFNQTVRGYSSEIAVITEEDGA